MRSRFLVELGAISFLIRWAAMRQSESRTLASRAEMKLAEPALAGRTLRRPAHTPSALKHGEMNGAPLFALDDGGVTAAEFGRAVHALLAEVEWASARDADGWSATWSARGGDSRAMTEAVECVRATELADVWKKKSGGEVWRERAFEIVLDGAWVTGVFDRVVVERDAAGRARRATVFDFKTDRVAADADLGIAAERHAAQLGVYCRVVARLTGLAERAVTGEVIFTRVRRKVRVTN